MNDYEKSFYYEKPSSVGSDVSGEAVGLGLGMGVGLVATIMSGILFLIGRMDILSSALLALICYLLTYTFEWHALVYIMGAVVIVGVSVLLQRYLKVFRIIYALFTCVSISFLVLMFKGYDSEKEMYAIFAISFIVTAVWEFISWKTIIYK